MKQLVALRRKRFQIARKSQAAQLLIDMAEGVDAIENFLTDITAFGVTHRLLFDSAFLREIGFIHVDAEAGNSSFDARGFQSIPAARSSTKGFGGGDDLLENAHQRRGGNKQIETA